MVHNLIVSLRLLPAQLMPAFMHNQPCLTVRGSESSWLLLSNAMYIPPSQHNFPRTFDSHHLS
jgi:hypothetical protein